MCAHYCDSCGVYLARARTAVQREREREERVLLDTPIERPTAMPARAITAALAIVLAEQITSFESG